MNDIVNVVGLGYIGLPTALIFAKNGVKVVGTDYNSDLVDNLNNERNLFEEDGLDLLFYDALKNGIKFTTKYIKTNFYIVAVPTPYEKSSKKIDSRYVVAAVKSILEICMEDSIIVIESTISPGTIDKHIRKVIDDSNLETNKNVHIVHAPERIIPGNMVYELENNSRTIGTDDYEIGKKVKKIYEKFCKSEINITDIKTAEMSKIVENTFRDVNIAFSNELAKICREGDMDIYEIIKIANKHPRVNILQPGPGVGGHCISVDPWFLVGDFPEITNIISTARAINDSMPSYVLSRIKTIMKENMVDKISKVGLYGMTYKENVDDTRESPTLALNEEIIKEFGVNAKVFDPFVKNNIIKGQYTNFENFINDIEVVVIMVAHDHIKNNMEKIKGKVILDTRNICSIKNLYKL